MEFIKKVKEAIYTRNDSELSKLLIIKWGSFTQEQVELSKSPKTLSPRIYIRDIWGTILDQYIACLRELDLSNGDDSERNYEGACVAANSALKYILENNLEYYRLSIRALINNAQSIAHRARENPKCDDKVETLLEGIVHIIDPKINDLLRNDKTNTTEQNKLILILCNTFVTIASVIGNKKRIIEETLGRVNPIIESNGAMFPISDVVSFNYFKGVSDITSEINEKFKYLKYAFDHCLKDSPNKRVILRSLVATAIVTRQDVYPSSKILEKYRLTDAYSGIIRSIKFGNPVLFDRELEKNVAIFSKWGLYFTIVKARFKLWRNICRFAQNYNIVNKVKRPDVVPFYLVRDIVTITTNGEYVPEDDEMECIFANTIAMKYINASLYIKGETKALILDLKDPFYLNKTN